MKIDVIELEISKKGTIEIQTDTNYVFGVEKAAPIFCSEIGKSNVEKVALLCLDSTHKIVNFSVISIGTISNVKPSISQLVKTALLSNASYLTKPNLL